MLDSNGWSCSRPYVVFVSILLFGVVSSFPTHAVRAQQTAPQLWVAQPATKEIEKKREVKRSLLVSVDASLLRAASNSRLGLVLPGGRRVTVTKVRQERVGEKGLVWLGRLEQDEGSSVTFSMVGEALVGDVRTSKG